MFRQFFPRSWQQWFGPIAAAGLIAAALGLFVLVSGVADLSASTPHPAGWAATLHYAFRRSVAHHADAEAVPADLDSPANVMKGATYYARACSHCHGAPQLGQNPVALMMRPQPQYLPAVARQFTAAQLFYIVRHGVKYSGMPAWPQQSRPDEVWPVVAFLRAMPRLTYAQFAGLAHGDAAAVRNQDTPGMAFGVPGKLRGYALYAPDQTAVRQQGAEQLYATPAMGFDPFTQTGDILTTCAACHGKDGAGRPGGAFPNLTIQTDTYLRDSLIGYARGTRKSAYMQTVATQLSPGQIDALASYYGARPAIASSSGQVIGDAKTLGARIVAYGMPQRQIGACTNCHGLQGASGDAFPRLQGQAYGYIVAQMKAFRGGGRGTTMGINPMRAVSHDLTDPEIAAIAAYYATTPPGAKALPAAKAAAQ